MLVYSSKKILWYEKSEIQVLRNKKIARIVGLESSKRFPVGIQINANLPNSSAKMALKKVKGNIERMFDKNLTDLVRGIRNNKENEVVKFLRLCFVSV